VVKAIDLSYAHVHAKGRKLSVSGPGAGRHYMA
jgi:hypothetical protein